LKIPRGNEGLTNKLMFKFVIRNKTYLACFFAYSVMPKKGGLYVGGTGKSMDEYCEINLTEEIQEFDGKIIDCKYADNQWIFVKVRNDRQHPNGRRTVVSKYLFVEGFLSS